MNRSLFLGLLAAVTILSSPVFAALPKASADKTKVIVQDMKSQDDVRKVLVPAKVESKIQSTITADFEGHVVEIVRPLGSFVKAREIILYMENRDPGFTYAKVPVRSPIAGVLSQLPPSQMSKVARGDKLFTVMDPGSLKLLAEFSASDLAVVRSGLRGNFKVAGQILPVKVIGLSPLIDPRTGTASAELEFVLDSKAATATLPAIGSIGQIQFDISQGSIFMIPENALSYQDGKPFVRILNEKNQVQKKTIDLGEQRESQFVIKSGLTVGEKVVVRSSRSLKDGEEVLIENPEAKNN